MSSTSVLLTIAIPTYNRNQPLQNLLKKLLPQVRRFKDECQLLIFDNASEQPVEDTLRETLQEYSELNIKIHRNIVNVGLSANLLRCFEFCQTEWMWLLGDDDLIFENACETIFEQLNLNRNAHFIHFASNLGRRKASFCVTGLHELLDSIDSYDNLNFMSVGVYRIPFYQPYIAIAYLYDYCLSPHLVLLFTGFAKTNLQGYFSDREIVEHLRPNEEKAWSRLEFYYRFLIILDIPCLNHSDRLLLYQRIIGDRRYEEYITTRYLLKAVRDGNPEESRYRYKHSIFRLVACNSSLFLKIKLFFYQFLFINPDLSLKAINFLLAMLKKPTLLLSEPSISLERL